MNSSPKIPPSVLAQLQDAAPDALVTLTVRTTTPLTTDENNVLTSGRSSKLRLRSCSVRC